MRNMWVKKNRKERNKKENKRREEKNKGSRKIEGKMEKKEGGKVLSPGFQAGISSCLVALCALTIRPCFFRLFLCAKFEFRKKIFVHYLHRV